jgi:hypothetical protein
MRLRVHKVISILLALIAICFVEHAGEGAYEEIDQTVKGLL